VDAVRKNTLQQSKHMKASIGEAKSAILDAHLLILQDPEQKILQTESASEARQLAQKYLEG